MATNRRRRRSSYNLRPAWATWRRIVVMGLLTCTLVGGTFAYRTVSALAKVFHTNTIGAIGQIIGGKGNSQIETDNVANLQRINIALFGYGGPPHDGPYLTDSIMIVSIQPRRDAPPQVAEISLPRDWFVPILLGNGREDHQRINAAYAFGMNGWGPVKAGDPGAGASVAIPTLEHLTGLDIKYFVGVDFTAFKSSVDAVGGVDINVTNSFTDYQYPAGECVDGRGCGFMTVHFNAGVQHMDGARALIFSRSRHGDHGEGSDFARSKRQQMVLTAVKEKVLSIGGIGSLPDLLNALGDHVLTNLSINDAQALYDVVKGVDPKAVTHVSLDDRNFLYECGYPTECGAAYIYAHDSSYKTVSHFLQDVFVDPGLVGQNAPVTILDGSGYGGGASTRWASIFSQLGWKMDDQGTAAHHHSTTQVIDNSGGRYAAVAKWFADFFGVTVTTPTPSPSATASASAGTSSGDGGIEIVLGHDEEASFNNHPGYGN